MSESMASQIYCYMEKNNGRAAQRERCTTSSEVDALVRRWRDRRARMYGLANVDLGHRCSYPGCVETGCIETVDEKRGLYGCILGGTYHVCKADTETCKLTTISEDGFVCSFSGAHLSAMIAENLYGRAKTSDCGYTLSDADDEGERTNELGRAGNFRSSDGPVRPNRSTFAPQNLQQDIDVVVADLLFNADERSRVDKLRTEQLSSGTAETVVKYYRRKRREREMPEIQELDALRFAASNKRMRTVPVRHDGPLRSYYTGLLTLFWHAMQRTRFFEENRSQFHPKQHAIGALYTLQTRLCVGDAETRVREIVGADGFLAGALPNRNDLSLWQSCHPKRWSYNKSDVTKGRNNMKRCLNELLSDEANRDLLDRIEAFARSRPAAPAFYI